MWPLASWLHDLAANPAGGWYGGMAVRAPVERTGKWAVASDQYAASEYPPYAKGGGYVLSRTVANRIVDAIRGGLSPLLSNVEDGMRSVIVTAPPGSMRTSGVPFATASLTNNPFPP